MVYFMQCEDGGPVKIGYSQDVATRHRQLEANYGRPLKVLATIPGGDAEERAIHIRFAHLRLGRTEQFRPTRELIKFIGKSPPTGPDPETVEAMRPKASILLVIRMTKEYRDWLDGLIVKFSETIGGGTISPQQLFERAMRDLARQEGFTPPPRRLD